MDGQITTSLHWIYRKLPTGRQNTQQSPHESVQEWEVKVRQAGSLCSYNALTDEMCRDKRERGRGYRTPRGRSQPRPLRDQNIHLLHTASDLHHVEYYTDDYQEQCYSLETRQIHNVHTDHAKKKYFVTLPMSATGNKFTPMTFQIDTAATYNTLSEDALLKLMPNMRLTKSPYLLHPYGDSQLLKPLGQIDLLCERNKRYESLTFQILPRDVMMNKPALLSGSD